MTDWLEARGVSADRVEGLQVWEDADHITASKLKLGPGQLGAISRVLGRRWVARHDSRRLARRDRG